MSDHRHSASNDTDQTRPAPHSLLRRRLTRFAKDETGAALIFILVLISLMLLSTGSAIDFLRHETARAKLQDALDRAVLAAASLSQKGNPQEVVEKYLTASGVGSDVVLDIDYSVDELNTKREVSVCATSGVNTTFLPLADISVLEVNTCSKAIEEIRPVEISLVLDISGSMRFKGTDSNLARIELLRPAAAKFIDIVMTDTELTTVNLVPYAGQVNIAPIFNHYSIYENLDEIPEGEDPDGREHTNSSCIELDETTEFKTAGLPTNTVTRYQVPHFMNWAMDWTWMDWGWCPQDASSIQVLQSSKDTLKTKINTMRLHDGTGTHYAMKWGLALLDPASQPVIGPLAAEKFQDRPAAWFDPDIKTTQTDKIIVLMTDGKIVEQRRPKDPYDTWFETHECADDQSKCERRRSQGQNFSSFEEICNTARDKRVRVFTVAMDVNDSNTNGYLKRCATYPGDFYNVKGEEIIDAFSDIAETINRLKLTF